MPTVADVRPLLRGAFDYRPWLAQPWGNTGLTTALELTESSTNVINHGDAVSARNISAGTIICAAYLTSVASAGSQYVGKKSGTPPGYLMHRRAADGTTFRGGVGRATSVQAAISTSVLTVNAWQFLAFGWNIAGSPQLFRGTLSTPVVDVTDGAGTDVGSGALLDDTGLDLKAGDLEGVTVAAGARIAWWAVVARQLTAAELEYIWRNGPQTTPDLRFFTIYGLNKTGLQFDYSGRGNHGTVTGATYAQGLPRVGWSAANRRITQVPAGEPLSAFIGEPFVGRSTF